MGHAIPVFFLPIGKRERPRKLSKWNDATNILNRYYKEGDKVGFRMATSRNWWLEAILDDVSKALGISGLEFIVQEIALLDTEKLKEAQSAIQILTENLTSGKIEIDTEIINKIWGFHADMAETKHNLLFHKAFQEAKPFYDSYVTDSFSSYIGVVDFFSFIKTLDAIIVETLENNKYLLIVQPQP